jgi:hypothetical protein
VGKGIARMEGRGVAGSHPGEAIERQTKPHRRIAWDQVEPLGTDEKRAAFPAGPRGCRLARDRQCVPDCRVQALLEHPCEASALELIVEL